jgi:hypothetical protein
MTAKMQAEPWERAARTAAVILIGTFILAEDPGHVALAFAPVIAGAVSPLVEPTAQPGFQFSDYDALDVRVGKDATQLDLLTV